MPLRFWARGHNNVQRTSLIQEVFDHLARAIMVRLTTGQPRYYQDDPEGSPIAAREVVAGGLPDAAVTATDNPTFEGAQLCGRVSFLWEGATGTPTITFEVYTRLDDVLRKDNPHSKDQSWFVGRYLKTATVTTLAHGAEVEVETKYRPILIRVTAAGGDGTLLIAPM